MRRLVPFCVALLCCPLLAHAQLRSIPEDAVRATMKPPFQNVAEVGKYAFRLAPGVQIRSPDNRILLPIMIDVELPVRYLLDANGDLSRVWILSQEEEDLPAPKQK